MDENLVRAAKFIRQWMSDHPKLKDLAEMYYDRNREDRAFLSKALIGIEPWKYMSFIPDWAFYGCHELTNVDIPNNVPIIGEKAFMCCENLESITLGDGVVNIEGEAFRDCTKLKKIIIPDGVSGLRYGPFKGCKGLTDVTLGTGIRYLGEYIFYGCEKLSNIKYKGTMKQFNDIAKDDNWRELRNPHGPGAFIYVKTVQCSDGVIDL